MNILITGAKGFVGRNLVENLKTLADGRNKTRPDLHITKIYEYDIDNTEAELDKFCSDCDFVFNLAGVNRPKDNSEFQAGNFGFASKLLTLLKKHSNLCPVMLSSSIQASLVGRFADSEYGRSKLAGEELFFKYEAETGSKVYVYRFPNLAGKWCKPNYNSAVATFCHNIANDLPITVNDPAVELELLFIDDLLEEMFDALEGKPHRCEYSKSNQCEYPSAGEAGGIDSITPIPDRNGRYCYCPVTHKATLGEIVDFLHSFKQLNETLLIPEIPEGSFASKLFSMYLSYLPPDKMSYPLRMNVDERGIFTELLKTKNTGQVSINITRPGKTRGLHWHNHKWEIFMVVAGHGIIQERKIGRVGEIGGVGTNPETINPETGKEGKEAKEYEVREFEVRGEDMKAVIMLPGYTHSITNLEKDRDLITVMWANEAFDEKKPDTFREDVSV